MILNAKGYGAISALAFLMCCRHEGITRIGDYWSVVQASREIPEAGKVAQTRLLRTVDGRHNQVEPSIDVYRVVENDCVVYNVLEGGILIKMVCGDREPETLLRISPEERWGLGPMGIVITQGLDTVDGRLGRVNFSFDYSSLCLAVRSRALGSFKAMGSLGSEIREGMRGAREYVEVSKGELGDSGAIRDLAISAIEGQKTNVLESLFQIGLDPNSSDAAGRTLLIRASRSSSAVVTTLVRAGASVNRADDSGYTALMYAAEHGNSEVVSALLAAGANPNLKNRYGQRALEIAREYHRTPVVELLEH